MVPTIWANIGSAYGLVATGTKPWPEPMLTSNSWGSVAFDNQTTNSRATMHNEFEHDDVIKWKHFPRYGEFHTQRPVTWSFDGCFDLRLNKRLSKQSWGWWFETVSWSLWRHCNENYIFKISATSLTGQWAWRVNSKYREIPCDC